MHAWIRPVPEWQNGNFFIIWHLVEPPHWLHINALINGTFYVMRTLICWPSRAGVRPLAGITLQISRPSLSYYSEEVRMRVEKKSIGTFHLSKV